MFCGKLKEKFVSERTTDKIEEEFQALEKGNRTVLEYARTFMDKLRFCKHLAPNEKTKVKRFLKGLPTSIRAFVRTSHVDTLEAAIEEAQIREDELIQEAKERRIEVERSIEKRKWTGPSGFHKRPYTGNSSGRRDSRSEGKWCSQCRKKHFGDCGGPKCIRCGRTGHVIKDCPNQEKTCYGCGEPGHIHPFCPKNKPMLTLPGLRQGSGSGSQPRREEPPRPKGRAFVMTDVEAGEAPDVVTGTFSVNNFSARVLFDSGANRSFVSSSFCKHFDNPMTRLEEPLVIETANGGLALVHDVFEDCYTYDGFDEEEC